VQDAKVLHVGLGIGESKGSFPARCRDGAP
jgi:hypothetical protein